MQLTLREWARKNGFEVGERGRISADIKAAFAKATGQEIPHPRPLVLSASRKDADAIREWGKENGFKVSEKGKLSAAVKAAYDKAMRKNARANVDPRILALAEQMIADEQARNSVTPTDKQGRQYKTQFCCWPLEERFEKFHTLCRGTIIGATLVGGIRKNVVCSCECHTREVQDTAAVV